ncbi:5-formyltetrahydrofolate cyclo-ligase [Paenibacillus agaridevorans]|uniref:5-formyltetrahydrofolate cyclo-ligase n=1 Tax=Paenibacillus agaridevorans TaxID=171404 RepID=UPI001BE42D6C|nr:5-formyltetrahydrofolate cyclo-ligase [Paenibacillus agaridevorans]
MDAPYVGQEKAKARAVYASDRNALDPEERLRWSIAACRHIADLVERERLRVIMAYVSFRSELDLSTLMQWCWQKDVRVIVPKSIVEGRSMTLHRLDSLAQLRAGAYGILEPDPNLAPPLEDDVVPELVLVPGLAFDRNGGRMGYGGGYYDRFWQRMSDSNERLGKQTLWLGASFEAQIRDEVPGEEHDLRLDGVVTEAAIYWRAGSHM